ncbi:MmgE/PrpD family protein [Meridianimarinicoccus sp. RP-17]|uniref:MmgE/PrpD family protein n=1 Tax=Meridianimarinicoccus zhengii TaxID=2056810 RepID=UPI0013A6AD49|nr:MmgE/PrpD family protein [Phycocomes zhengii]
MKDRTETQAHARGLAEFAASVQLSDIPPDVRARGLLHILDGLGLGLASTRHDFAASAVAGVAALSAGDDRCTMIGQTLRAAPRDAALANGILIHGLDFDDTHQQAIVHPTAACLPAALAIAEERGMSGEALLVAYCIGMEAAIRIGAAVQGGFHHTGFHATGIVAHFASALSAGRLLGLGPDALVAAQGIAASTASGVQVFLEEGAWTKRFHPGWAAVGGITAATFAQHAFRGPSRAYEGRFGLFETHLQGDGHDLAPAFLTDALGARWMMADTALKPYPVCHFIHGAADAALSAHEEIAGSPIAEVEIRLPADTMPIVAEPQAAKRAAATEYEAKFSAHYVVGTCLLRGAFTLADLTGDALADPAVKALMPRVTCVIDQDSAFPTYFSGGVRVRLEDGRVVDRHVRVNSGAGERMMDRDAVSAKFHANADPVLGHERSASLRQTVLNLGSRSARELARGLSGSTE